MLADLIAPEAILSDVWMRFGACIDQPKHPFRTPALTTLDLAGAPASRTIVLRQAKPDLRQLRFHTDRRSPKHAQIQRDARTSLLFYDPADLLQLRITATATLHDTDAIAIENWNLLNAHNRTLYTAMLTPGTVLPHMAPAVTNARTDGRDNFATVCCTVQTLDWLYLHPHGHRRAFFRWQGPTLKTEWLAP